MLRNTTINKNNIDAILERFSKNYAELSNKRIDLYLVGGSSIVINFDYRESTIDIDAFYEETDQIKQSITKTAKDLNLPCDWLNQDFVNTPSFSNKLKSVSILYKEYGCLGVYTIKPLYLVAMKLKSSRPTGGDLDDIIQMIYEFRISGEDVKYSDVIAAYDYLYNDRSNTYESFFRKTKEAFETPIDEVKEFVEHQKMMRG